MRFFKKTIIGIDFNDYYAQLIEMSLDNNQVVLESYGRTLLQPNVMKHSEIVDEEKFITTLGDLLKNANPKPIISKNIAIVFPSTKVFTHIFKLPKTLVDKDVKKALEFEAETVIPFAISDVYWDFTVLETDEKSKYVLFVAITKAIADKYCEVLEAAEVTPLVFGVDVEALKYSTAKQLDTEEPALVVDFSAFSTNYLVIKNGIVKDFFATSQGGINLIERLSKESGTAIEEILRQKETNNLDAKYIQTINKYFQKNYGIGKKILEENEKKISIGPINEVILTGQFLTLPDFHSNAEKNFTGKRISIGDPRHYLSIDSAKFKALDNSNNIAIYSTNFVNAAGIALRVLFERKDEGINLLPDRLKSKIKEKRRRLLIVLCSAFMCLFTLCLASWMFFKFQEFSYLREYLTVQKSQIENIVYGTRYQEVKEEIMRFNNEVTTLSEIDGELFSLSKTTQDIISLIPKGISLTSFSFDDSSLTIGLSGVARDREDLLKATQVFKESKFVSEVIIPISNYDQKTSISFVIELRLNFKELKKYGVSSYNK